MLSSFVCSLVEETKKDGLIDVTQAYNKIINSIKEAEEAAKMADKAANDTLEVQGIHTDTHSHSHTHTHTFFCLYEHTQLKQLVQLALKYLFVHVWPPIFVCVCVCMRVCVSVCVFVEHTGPRPRSGRGFSEEPQFGAEGRGGKVK